MIDTIFPSNQYTSNEMRAAIARVQTQLAQAQKELSTGRHADAGLTLGADTGKAISFRNNINFFEAVLGTNGSVATRMDTAQIGLQSISDNAQAFLAALVNAKTSTAAAGVAVVDAQARFKSFISDLNTSVDGQFVFAGTNSDVKPMDDYFAVPASAAKQTFDAAFLAKFGFDQQSSNVASIPASAMRDFLDNEFADTFAAANWQSAWSAASPSNVMSRISATQIVQTSVNSNDQAFRKIASAFVAVGVAGFEKMNDAAKSAVLDRAIAQLGEGLADISTLQSTVGVAQERLSKASDILTLQKNLSVASLDKLEGVDPAEAATRISALMTQLETAFTLTKRLNDLSLLKYL